MSENLLTNLTKCKLKSKFQIWHFCLKWKNKNNISDTDNILSDFSNCDVIFVKKSDMLWIEDHLGMHVFKIKFYVTCESQCTKVVLVCLSWIV